MTVAVLLGWSGLGCRGDEGREAGSELPRPTSVFEGVELVHQEEGGDWWRLTAAEGAGWEGEGTGSLREVRGEIRRGGHALRLEAGGADIDGRDVVRLSGGVEVAWDAYRAHLDRAEYRPGQGRVTSDDAVSLEGAGLRVRGRGLEVDVEKRTARVREGVEASVGGGTP
ncbi:MAG: LPS export ABC transporter periplasmic protein LptC [Thermodesulfobacteriota bacterium]